MYLFQMYSISHFNTHIRCHIVQSPPLLASLSKMANTCSLIARCRYLTSVSVSTSRVLLQRGVPGHPHVRHRPDQQRPLRHVPDDALPGAHGARGGHLRQRQHHLPQRLPPAPGHVLPGTLHRGPPLRTLQQYASDSLSVGRLLLRSS